MFRFENKLPKYMVNESRDFLLMSRLQDSIFMGQRGDIYTITNLNNSNKCKNSVLDLLAKKVGFFTTKYIDDNVLRYIIGAFLIAVKNKGTKLGIIQAVTAILKAENSIDEPQVEIYTENLMNPDDSYLIRIYTPVVIVNKIALEEFLKYIIPAGWTYTIQAYQKSDEPYTTIMLIDDLVKLLETSPVLTSRIRNSNDEYGNVGMGFADTVLGTVDLGVIPSQTDYYGDDNINGYISRNPDLTSDNEPLITESIYLSNLEVKLKDE